MRIQNSVNRSSGSKKIPTTLLSKALEAAIEFTGFGSVHAHSTYLPKPTRRSKSPLIIGVASFKGGAGKTTLAVNIAVGSVRSNLETFLIDADAGQASSERWGWARNRRGLPELANLPVRAVAELNLAKTLKNVKLLAWPVIIVDFPGSSRPALTEAFKLCDLVLVPCRPTAVDVRSAKSTMKILKSLRVSAAFVLTQAPPSFERVERFREVLAIDGIVLPTYLGSRVVYQDCCARGLGVLEGSDLLAKREMEDLMSNIKASIDPKKK
jgi:chromosome partitioning protein